MNNSIFEQYWRYRSETTALAANNTAKRFMVRAWNSCAAAVNDWHLQCLTEPPRKVTELTWEVFPVGLRRDLDEYFAGLAQIHRTLKGKRIQACSPATIATRRAEMVAMAWMAVRLGVPIESLTSLGALLHPDVTKRVIDAYWEKNGEEPKTGTIDLGWKVLRMARETRCLDQTALDRLDDIRIALEQHRLDGLTPKNLQLVRQVLTDGVWSEVVSLPNVLMEQARLAKDHAPRKAASSSILKFDVLTSLSVPVYPFTYKRTRIYMAKRSHPSNPLALAVLALLFERPMHPYEMGLIMKQRHKEDSIKLRYGSLYTVIDLLLARGFISARGVARDGRRPERTVYEITKAGREELRAWMTDLIGEPVKEYPQFEAALCLLPVLPPDEALALLRQRLTRIDAKATELEGQSAHPAVQNLPPLFLVENEYRLALVKAEQRFIAELITRIENGWGPLELWRSFHQNREATMTRLYREYGGGPMTQ